MIQTLPRLIDADVEQMLASFQRKSTVAQIAKNVIPGYVETHSASLQTPVHYCKCLQHVTWESELNHGEIEEGSKVEPNPLKTMK